MNRSASRKSRKPKQERGIKTCNQIVSAARELFEEKGYHHTNSKEIAARAGVAVGTFYGYFEGKKPLFLEVLSRYYEEISSTALTISPEDIQRLDDPHHMVRLLISRMYDAHQIGPEFHREVMVMIYADEDVADHVRKREEEVIARLMMLFSLVEDKLTVDDSQLAARLVHRTAEEIIHQLRIFGLPAPERTLDQLAEMIYKYLFT